MKKKSQGKPKVAEIMDSSQKENESLPQGILAGGGEMAKLIGATDWSKSPLGPIESWPQSLLTTVSLCLASNFPISMAWGPAHIQIYNDGYLPICGSHHPRSMGQDFRECWASSWPQIGEAYEGAWAGGSSFIENMRTFVTRNGFLEEAFFTFSFSPIRDETGEVGGIFHPVTEKTVEMLSERRTRAIRDLAARTGKAKSVEEVFTLATATLSDYQPDLPFVLFYRLHEKETQARLTATTGLPSGSPACPELVDLKTFGAWPFAETVRSGKALLVDDLENRFEPFICGPYPESPNAALVMPINAPGSASPYAIMVAGVSPRLALDEVYRDFYDMLASNINAAVANAQAYEEERKRAEALAEIDRAKTAFFSNVSHEFRTPLTLMLGPIEDLLARNGHPAEEQELLKVAHRNALRLQKLVNTLLDFSRIEAGRVQASFRATNVSGLTAELASNFRSAIEKAGLKLKVDCPSLPESLYIDRDMWEKIVLNLISNAFKHTFEGEIKVAMRWLGTQAELVVQDSGIGIPPDQLPYLFDRFHQVPNTRSRTHEGSGIGLALVKELVALHGGTISVESVVDRGTTFTISIPAGKKHLPADRIEAESELASTAVGATPYIEEALRWLPENDTEIDHRSSGLHNPEFPEEAWQGTTPGDTRKARIILADDNTDMRDYVRRLLEPYCEVVPVSNGKAALQAAKTTLPDLVLSDVMMPEMNGFELLKALRNESDLKSIPVILLSARAGEEARVEGLKAGADDYLSKPFNARELLAKISANLSLHRVRKEAFYALQKNLEREKLVAKIVESIRSETDLNSVLQKTIDVLGAFTKADRVTIWLYNSDQNQFMIPENEYRSSDDIARIADTSFPHNPVLPFGINYQEVINLPKILETENLTEEDRQMIAERGIQSLLHVPILYEQQLLGILQIHAIREKRKWDSETIGIVEQVAAQVAIAIHKATLMKELKEAVALKTAILESALDAIVNMNHQGKIIAWNSAAEKIFGYSRTEAIGRNMAELIIPERFTEFHQNDLGHYLATAGSPIVNKLFEIPTLRADGTEILSELTISPVPIEGPPLFTVTLRDISERKQAELALQESEERFRNMADAAPVIIWMGNTKGENIYFNTTWSTLTGRKYEEDAQYGWKEVIHPDDLGPIWEIYKNALKNRDSFTVEFRVRNDDQEYRLLKCQGSPRQSVTGEFLGFVGICEDITEQRNAEESNRYQSYLMQSITDNATAGLFMMDINGICTFMNPAAEEISGYTFDEIRQDPKKPLHDWIHHLHPDGTHYPMADCPIDRALPENNDVRAHEDVFVRKDGSFYNVSCAARPIIKDGIPVGTLVEVRDITERKKAEQAIKESEEHFRTFANNIQNLAWMVDPEGHAYWYNQRWYDYTGSTFEEVQGWGWEKVLHPDHASRVLDFVKEAWKKGETWESTYPLRGANGQYRWFLTRAFPAKDAEGNIVHWIGTNTDITEQKTAEEELKKFKFISDYAFDAFILIREDGTFAYLNDLALKRWGYSREEALQIRVPDVEPVYQEEKFKEVFALAQKQYIPPFETIHKRKDGTTYPVEISMGGINLEGKPHMFAVARDITERKLAEETLRARNEELQKINNDLDNFIYTASHDLKAPITNIEGLMHLLVRHLPPESLEIPVVDKVVSMTQTSIARFKKTISDLTELTKLQKSSEDDVSQVHFSELLEEILLDQETLIQDSGAKLEVDFSPYPSIRFSNKNLRSVLYNLVSNAIKYRSPEREPFVRISTRMEQDFCVLTVEDNGLGMNLSKERKIFSMFQRLHDHVEGSGIGLYIVKKIVENSGGTIKVESEVGKGSTFRVYLPVN